MATAATVSDAQTQAISLANVTRMLEACSKGDGETVQTLVHENQIYACQQDEVSGQSPLMVASATGNLPLVQFLLESGAPWNALDRQGQCAGDYATNAEHWEVVNLLVDWATRSELILGAAQRGQRERDTTTAIVTTHNGQSASATTAAHSHQQQLPGLPESHQSSTKPDYLQQPLRYNEDGSALLDADKDAVMMEWERPLMKAHAQILMEKVSPADSTYRKRVLNVGFGMGIIDDALQEFNPSLHIIIEAHPDVHRRMLELKWDQKENVRICFGRWQYWLPQLIQQGVVVDAIFFDTYGEHFTDMEDFHHTMVRMLSKPHGIYSFFNGLAPDNLFFHGVACQCVKLQLQQLGLDSEFLPCQIQVDDKAWEGVRRKYWHGRDTYYLPRVTWNPQAIHGTIVAEEHDGKNKISPAKQDNDVMEMEVEAKRPRTDG